MIQRSMAMNSRRGIATLLAGLLWSAALAQPDIDFDAATIDILPVTGNIYMLVGPVGNSTVQVGDDGVLVVDTQFAELSDKILAAIRTLSDKPIRYLVNTHYHADHTGGNAPLALAGNTIAGGNVAGDISNAGAGATIIAHENALFAMLAQTPAPDSSALPNDTFFLDQKDIYFNGEPVVLYFQPGAHSNGDILVHFRRSDVISAGDLFVTTSYPYIDLAQGGHINGILAGLNTLLKLMVPKEKQEDGTLVIPGHGRLGDEADVVEFRDMLTIIRDRVNAMVDRGLSLEEVQAARPTLDYDGRYGSDSGFWTTQQFVAAIYQNLRDG